MLDWIFIYRWNLMGGAVLAMALSQLGAQLAARERAMQTVCVSQGALIGVLLALGGFGMPEMMAEGHGPEAAAHFAPLGLALLCSGLTFAATDWLARRRGVSRNALFATCFGILIAMSQLVSALFPGLESHQSQIYFGDLATLPESDAKIALGLGAVLGMTLWRGRLGLTGASFDAAVFGGRMPRVSAFFGSDLQFFLVALTLLSFSVHFLGFLYTIAVLFIPTTVLAQARAQGLHRHLRRVQWVSALGVSSGLILSLSLPRLPTVPTITVLISLIAWVLVGLEGRIVKAHRSSSETAPDGGVYS